VKLKGQKHAGVQELCRKLKDQLEELEQELIPKDAHLALEEVARRTQLIERLKAQLSELSS
jgi:uncharacterized membrane protein YccC